MNLARLIAQEGGKITESRIRRIGRGVLEGLQSLCMLGIVHRNISPDTILLSESESASLADWGVFYATDGGRLASLHVGTDSYSAPEVLVASDKSVWKSDMWSLGVCLFELFCGTNPLSRISEVMSSICNPSSGKDALRALLDVPALDRCSRELKEFLFNCLQVNPCDRWDCWTAARCPFFSMVSDEEFAWVPAPFVRSELLIAPSVEQVFPHLGKTITARRHQRERSVDVLPEPTVGSFTSSSSSLPKVVEDEVFDAKAPEPKENEFHVLIEGLTLAASSAKYGFENVFPELSLVPLYTDVPLVLEDSFVRSYDQKVYSITLDEAKARLAALKLHPEILSKRDVFFESWNADDALPTSLDTRDRDVGYQRCRVGVFLPLLEARDMKGVMKEVGRDVPPALRMEIWAVLLAVPSWEACAAEWNEINTDVEGPSDRQIEVDVPRCNARHESIGTPEGRRKLTRVLKAWVATNPGLEYWQGLDSLAAPFVALSCLGDKSEGRAFAMLQRMVRRYLSGMFLQKNTSQLQTQLIVFNQLLAFHDPKLFMHLHNQQFNPELFAIPWFLTLFTHILPIESTFRLWDFMFQYDASMIYFISMAVMRQIRRQLLSIDFNDLVLFFSELHSKQSLDMAKVLADAEKISRVTPTSLCSDHSVNNSQQWWEQKGSLQSLQENFSPKLSVADLMMLLKGNKVPLLVFDVRPPEEYRAVHLDGAINIAPKDVDVKAVEQMRVKKPIIVVIASKGKQAELPNLLVKSGIPRVTYLSGGMDALALNSDAVQRMVMSDK